MRFKHTNRPGFWFGFIDFCTAGLFFLFYMPLGGLQDELDAILGRRTQRYWVAYLLGIPTLFIYTLVWMAIIAEELKAKAIELGIDGPHTSWWQKLICFLCIAFVCYGLTLSPFCFTKSNCDTLSRLKTGNSRRAERALFRSPAQPCRAVTAEARISRRWCL